MEEVNGKKTFKILSIDGGGIKGLYPASILRKFEEKFNCLTSDHFDMICGTSTGGLIALAIASHIPAKDICRFYEERGEIIFPKHRLKLPFFGRTDLFFLKQLLFWGKYSDKGLKKALFEIFGENKIKDSNNLLCIPSYSITKAQPRVFKYDHKEGKLSTDNNLSMVDVALATSAAPTYFPIANIANLHNEQFIDGGVWANNPTLVGLLEAINHFVGKDEKKEYDKIQILSLSSLSITEGKPPGIRRNRSFVGWKSDLFNTTFTGQSFFSDFFMTKIKEIGDIKIDYIRIPSEKLSREHESFIQLDVANIHSYELMKIKADHQAALFEKEAKIIELFTKKKTYTINHG